MKSFFSSLVTILLLAFLTSSSLFAQNLNLQEDPAVSQLVNSVELLQKSLTEISGWRVQILATTNRVKIEEAKTGFLRKFPHIQPQWIYNEPYYKLRVGAYRSKLAAYKLLYQIKEEYPRAYVTKVRKIPVRDFIYQ